MTRRVDHSRSNGRASGLNRLWIPVFLALCLGGSAPAQETSAADQARRLMHQGQYRQAQELLEAGQEADPHRLRLLWELAHRSGRLDDADRLAKRLLGLYSSGALTTPQGLAEAAFAAWRLDLWQQANDIFMSASQSTGAPVQLYVDWGNLYVEKYAAAEALDIFKDGLSAAGDNPPAALFVGMARAKQTLSQPATPTLDRALEIDPENLEALALKAEWSVSSLNWAETEKWIDQGLELNGAYLPLLEQKAVMHYFRGDREAYREAVEQVLGINARDSDLYEALGDAAVLQRRMNEAHEFYQKAVEFNPRQWSSWASMGINMLRLGMDEGKQVLEKAYDNDPFNIWTVNTLRLLDSFERFETFETEHFIVRIRKDEAPVLRPYVEELLERAVTEFEAKYDHQIEGKYRFEMYPDHEDFAVRALGMPGLGALGAAFGRVVAMDSPSARPKGEFHWGSTLWHEVAHVITLSLSKNKVPRWFTEGLSMMEERLVHPGWGDLIGPNYVKAFRDDKLLHLSDLNDGFLRPKSGQQIQISYLQAGWLCDFIAAEFGFEKIREMLLAYADGLTDEEVFPKVLGQSLKQIDDRFFQIMETQLRPLVDSLQAAEGQIESFKTSAEARQALSEKPSSFFLNLRLAQLLIDEGNPSEAVPYLEKAIEILPSSTSPRGPYALLLKARREMGETSGIIDALERWWKANPKIAEHALELAELLAANDQAEQAAAYLEESMFVAPFDETAHRRLGEAYLTLNKADKAVREFEVQLALKPNDAAGTRFRLGQALHLRGDNDAAKRQVLLSLEMAPGYVQAQKLLLELVREGKVGQP